MQLDNSNDPLLCVLSLHHSLHIPYSAVSICEYSLTDPAKKINSYFSILNDIPQNIQKLWLQFDTYPIFIFKVLKLLIYTDSKILQKNTNIVTT